MKQFACVASDENIRSNENVYDLTELLPSVDDTCSVNSIFSLSSPKIRMSAKFALELFAKKKVGINVKIK